jgi:thiamine monophosphate synthase
MLIIKSDRLEVLHKEVQSAVEKAIASEVLSYQRRIKRLEDQRDLWKKRVSFYKDYAKKYQRELILERNKK